MELNLFLLLIFYGMFSVWVGVIIIFVGIWFKHRLLSSCTKALGIVFMVTGMSFIFIMVLEYTLKEYFTNI